MKSIHQTKKTEGTFPIQVHPVALLETYFEQEISRLSPKKNFTRKEVRDLGRTVGRKISSIVYSPEDHPLACQLLRRTADLICEFIPEPSYQSACWGNLSKGFVGETASFITGQQRAALLDSIERQMPEHHCIFFRYPQLRTAEEHALYDKMAVLVRKNFPTITEQDAHESCFLLYNMSQIRKDLKAHSKPPITSYESIADKLLQTSKQYIKLNASRTLPDILRVLSRISAIYDKASYRILQGRRVQETFKKSGFIASTKHDLLRRIRTPVQIQALLTPGVQHAAASLVARGSYLGRLYLDTLTEFPVYASTLHLNKPQSEESLHEDLIAINDGKGFFDSHLAIKEFISTCYLNIGLGCLNQQPGHNTYYENVSEDVAQLSEFMFKKIVELSFRTLSEKYEVPTAKVAFIGGGANARREYPSFDYDWYCAYEHEGVVRSLNGEAPITYKDFFTLLAKKVNSNLILIGASSDIGFAPHDPITHETHWASTKDSYNKLLQRSADAHLELRLRVGGIVLGGDAEFGQDWLSYIRKLEQANSQDILTVRAQHIRTFSEEALSFKNGINIKSAPGGLRQATRLWLFCDTAFDQRFESLQEVTQFLCDHGYASTLTQEQFLSSYRFLLGLRVRLDMQYGRNDKHLPEGGELIALAKSLGFEHSKRIGADTLLLDAVKYHMGIIRNLSISIITNLRDSLLEERGYDIFDNSRIKALEEITQSARHEYLHFQAMRREELPWDDGFYL